jgi:NADPH:quinone reductase-like Zn-dependent oxidoreductase
MKAVRIYQYGHSDQMKVEDVIPPIPPGEHELLIEVRAAGVNPIDWKIREGLRTSRRPVNFPLTLGQDFAGKVIEIGEAVHGYKVGDDVYGFALHGAYAEIVTAGEDTIAKIPVGIDYDTAAAIPTAGLTAYQIIEALDLQPGQHVLIHGAAGGVGSFAVQLALWKKAKVFVSVKGADVEYLEKMGANHVINYEEERFEDRAGQMDAVIDLVGGETLKRSYEVVNHGGIIITTVHEMDEKITRRKGIRGINFMMKRNSENLAHMAELLQQKVIEPRVIEKIPLEDARKALDDQQFHHSNGKIVIQISH